jgi:hypothetical protein
MPDAFRLDYVAKTALETPPRHSFETLSDQLIAIREAGVCITHGEVDANAVGVAAPVFRHEEVVAAISVAGPVSRLRGRRLRETEQLVRLAARQVEGMLDRTIDAQEATLGVVGQAGTGTHPHQRQRALRGTRVRPGQAVLRARRPS